MTGLIERLRKIAENQRHARGDYLTYGEPDPWIVEASDALEKLREYARHTIGCEGGWKNTCDCGLSDLLRELSHDQS